MAERQHTQECSARRLIPIIQGATQVLMTLQLTQPSRFEIELHGLKLIAEWVQMVVMYPHRKWREVGHDWQAMESRNDAARAILELDHPDKNVITFVRQCLRGPNLNKYISTIKIHCC